MQRIAGRQPLRDAQQRMRAKDAKENYKDLSNAELRRKRQDNMTKTGRPVKGREDLVEDINNELKRRSRE